VLEHPSPLTTSNLQGVDMAEQHHESGADTPATCYRLYTVGYVREHRKFTTSPAITLKGHCMEELGFETG